MVEVAISLFEVMVVFLDYIEKFVPVVVGNLLGGFMVFQYVFECGNLVFPELLFMFRKVLVNFLVQNRY